MILTLSLVFFVKVLFFFPYGETAEIDLATITDRMAVKKAVQNGHVEDAIEKVNDLNPEVYNNNQSMPSLSLLV